MRPSLNGCGRTRDLKDLVLQIRPRIPKELRSYLPLLGVGLKHLILADQMPPPPNFKDRDLVRAQLKLVGFDADNLNALKAWGRSVSSIVTSALEAAARCRLNP